jgi:hypothetical protein
MEFEWLIGYLQEMCWTASHYIVDSGGIFISAADLGFLYRSDSCCIIASPVEERINTAHTTSFDQVLIVFACLFFASKTERSLFDHTIEPQLCRRHLSNLSSKNCPWMYMVDIRLYIYSPQGPTILMAPTLFLFIHPPLIFFSQFLSFSPCSRYSSLPCL